MSIRISSTRTNPEKRFWYQIYIKNIYKRRVNSLSLSRFYGISKPETFVIKRLEISFIADWQMDTDLVLQWVPGNQEVRRHRLFRADQQVQSCQVYQRDRDDPLDLQQESFQTVVYFHFYFYQRKTVRSVITTSVFRSVRWTENYSQKLSSLA